MFKLFPVCLYASAILILLLLDYSHGSCVVQSMKKLCCRVVCYVVRRITDENIEFNVPLLLTEWIFLIIFVMISRGPKRSPAKDKIDDQLAKIKETLKRTEEFIEKWRVENVNYYKRSNDYLDVEPQKLEVPILHMAIIDTIGKRNQFERGDEAADTYDRTILSMTSLFDNLSTFSDEATNFDEKATEFDERRLWDFTEDNYSEEL